MAGSIEKRGENSWRLVVSCGLGANGKQIKKTKTVTCKDSKEAGKELAKFITAIESGNVANSGKMTLKEFFQYWLENYAEGHHEPKTILRNKELFARIDQSLGRIRIDKLEPRHLLSFYKNLAEPGIKKVQQKKNSKEPPPMECLSANTIQKHHKLLSAMLVKAVQWGFIPYNLCERVEAPKATHQQISILDESQTIEFLKLLETEELKYKLLVLIALSTGLRRGEIFGLEWSHIDFEKNIFDIQQASQYLPYTGLITKSPKNESSKRLIAVPESVMELLKQFKAEQNADRLKLGDKWQKSNRVFVTWNGAPMHPDSFNKWLRKFIADNNLPHISPHSFRHMSATFALVQGISLKSVSARLGHSKTSTTADIYSHALKSVDRDIADKMNTFINIAKQPTEIIKGQAN